MGFQRNSTRDGKMNSRTIKTQYMLRLRAQCILVIDTAVLVARVGVPQIGFEEASLMSSNRLVIDMVIIHGLVVCLE